MSKDRTAQFVAAMAKGRAPEAEPAPPNSPSPPPPQTATVHEMPRASKPPRKAKAAKSRAELKHFGGYLDDETLEKIALLRIRLKMDNSELIQHAMDELHRKHSAKRAFGDA
jgi:hypothetical protein